MKATIAFIGGGNMAGSLIAGMCEAGTAAASILVAEPDAERRQALQTSYGIHTTDNNIECLQQDMVVLAVKPQALAGVCHELQPHLKSPAPTFISIAAGLRSAAIDGWLGGGQAIVRCMPNTPAMLQCGATGMFANSNVTTANRTTAEAILASVGITVWVDTETGLDAITAVSGSGPAYYFLMMEAMTQAGIELGLEADVAQQLVSQTALGAARMMAEGELDAATLRANVTSKGGTTEQAILAFEQAGFRDMVKHALNAAHDRSITLANELADAQ